MLLLKVLPSTLMVTGCLMSVLAMAEDATQGVSSDSVGAVVETEKPNAGYYEIQNVLHSVLETLVEQQIIDREKAQAIKKKAAEQAQEQASREVTPKQLIVNEPPLPPTEKVIRVPYVPEHTKQQMRDEIQNGLREDTVKAVLSQAKQERWGMPGVTPEWVDRIEWKGDIRVRLQLDTFAEDNERDTYVNILALNKAGSIVGAGDELFLNTTEDRARMRIRARLAMDAKVTQGLSAGFRITTGGTSDPVSTNQTLGGSFSRSEVVWDRMYLRYKDTNLDGYNWLTLHAGRMPNPWLGTDLSWDSDLNFDGLAATYRANLRGSDSLFDMSEEDRTLFFTLGAFPLQEVALSSDDKWLFGAQVGTELVFENSSVLKLGLGYYDYVNIVGKKNSLNSSEFDYTAPQYLQKGNTVNFNIRDDNSPDERLMALSSDYNIVNFTLEYTLAQFAPHTLVLTADYVKNIGFDQDDIRKLTNEIVDEKTEGYQLQISYGWSRLDLRDRWRLSLAYKYLERDAVLDAFTDSDFHLGGTNAKGYIIAGEYAVMDNTVLGLRYLSADQIDGAPFGIDVVQLDVVAHF